VAGSKSSSATLIVHVVEGQSQDQVLWSPGRGLYTTMGVKILTTNPCRNVVQAYEGLVLVPPKPMQITAGGERIARNNGSPSVQFVYELFNARARGQNLISNDRLLMKGAAYWSNANRNRPLLGVRRNVLGPGQYAIVLSVLGDGAPGRTLANDGLEWTFSVAPTPQLVVSMSPIARAVPSETVFYASATSVPRGDQLFYFALRERESNLRTTPVTPRDCLGDCSGDRVVSFVIPREGNFLLQVDMVGSTSDRIASAFGDKTIYVGPPDTRNPEVPSLLMTSVLAAAAQKNEVDYWQATGLLGPRTAANLSLSSVFVTNVTDTLLDLARRSVLSDIQATKLVDAGTALLTRPTAGRRDILSTLYGVNQAAVNRITRGNAGLHLVPALSSFYGQASWTVHVSFLSTVRYESTVPERISARQDQSGRAASLLASAYELRTAASRDITRAMVRGRECGYVARTAFAGSVPGTENIIWGNSACGLAALGGPIALCESSESGDAVAEEMIVGLATFGGADTDQRVVQAKADRLVTPPARPIVSRQNFAWTSPSRSTGEENSCLNVTLHFNASSNLFKSAGDVFESSKVVQCPSAVTLFTIELVRDAKSGETTLRSIDRSPVPGDFGGVEFQRNGTLVVRAEVQLEGEVYGTLNETVLLRCAKAEVHGPWHIPFWTTLSIMLLVLLLLSGCTAGLFLYFRRRRRRNREVKALSPPAPLGDDEAIPKMAIFGDDEGPESAQSKNMERSWGEAQDRRERGPRIFLDPESDEERVCSAELELGSAMQASTVRGADGSVVAGTPGGASARLWDPLQAVDSTTSSGSGYASDPSLDVTLPGSELVMGGERVVHRL
jgi:hypothetical protein